LGFLLTASSVQAGGCGLLTYKAGTAPAIPFVSPHANGESNQPATIVGLWHVIYTATYDDNFPPGGPFPSTPFQFAETFKTWHAEGVWKELGDNRVKLHHIGAMFAADGSVSSFFTVDEIDTVAANDKTYSGSFVFRLWPPSYEAVGVGVPIAELKGTTAATRISVD
jgi:hypothetical protein